MQTPEPPLETNQQRGASEEETKLDPSLQQAGQFTDETTPEQQEEKEQQRTPPIGAEEATPEKLASYSEEDVLKGLVYPPPPTFYEQRQPPVERPTVRQTPPTRYVPEAARAATSYVPPRTPYPNSYPMGPTTTRQASPISQAPAKRSRTWVWVVVAIMSIALIASGSLCGWAANSVFSRVFQQVQGIEETVNGFYSAMQTQKYDQAYSYLALTGTQQNLTQAQFTQMATQEDSKYGQVLSYTPNTPELGANSRETTNINQSTITVRVGRKQKNYTVTLVLRKEGNTWKITAYNQL